MTDFYNAADCLHRLIRLREKYIKGNVQRGLQKSQLKNLLVYFKYSSSHLYHATVTIQFDLPTYLNVNENNQKT